eukprot:263344_1
MCYCILFFFFFFFFSVSSVNNCALPVSVIASIISLMLAFLVWLISVAAQKVEFLNITDEVILDDIAFPDGEELGVIYCLVDNYVDNETKEKYYLISMSNSSAWFNDIEMIIVNNSLSKYNNTQNIVSKYNPFFFPVNCPYQKPWICGDFPWSTTYSVCTSPLTYDNLIFYDAEYLYGDNYLKFEPEFGILFSNGSYIIHTHSSTTPLYGNIGAICFNDGTYLLMYMGDVTGNGFFIRYDYLDKNGNEMVYNQYNKYLTFAGLNGEVNYYDGITESKFYDENNNINIKSYLLTYWIEGYYADWWAIGGIIQNISNNGQIRSTLPFRITQQYDAIIQMHNNFNVISMNVFPNYCCYLIASCSYYEPNNSIRLNVINNKGINVFGEGKDIIIADPTDTSYYLYQMIELKMLNNNQNGYKYFMVAYANHVNNNTTIAAKVLYLHYINNQFTLSVVNQTFIFTDINDPNYLDSFCMYILDDFQSIIMAWGVINNDKITKRPVSTSINAKIWNFSLST